MTRGDAFTSSCGAARNPDPKAQWPRKRNWNNSRPASWTVANTERLCTGSRQSKDVIVYLGQKTHSSYDATHANTLNASMASLRKYMKRIRDTDVIVWHEGDLANEDANALDGAARAPFAPLRGFLLSIFDLLAPPPAVPPNCRNRHPRRSVARAERPPPRIRFRTRA